MFSRIYLALFSQKYVSFSKSRRTDGNITVFRDGEGRCGRYCLLLEIMMPLEGRGFESLRLRQKSRMRKQSGFLLLTSSLFTKLAFVALVSNKSSSSTRRRVVEVLFFCGFSSRIKALSKLHPQAKRKSRLRLS